MGTKVEFRLRQRRDLKRTRDARVNRSGGGTDRARKERSEMTGHPTKPPLRPGGFFLLIFPAKFPYATISA